MRYFTPTFKIASLTGDPDRLVSKIGGVPWGLPADLWPSCCGCPQKLLAQFRHEPPMLDLGSSGSVLYLFHCLECCGFDECGHSALIVEASKLGEEPVRVPGYDHVCDLGGPLIGEFLLDGWTENDDGIYWTLENEFPDIDFLDPLVRTRFGGVPRWTVNGPGQVPPAPFEFLFQINNYLYFDGPAPQADEVGCVVAGCLQPSGERVTVLPQSDRKKANAPWGIMNEPEWGLHSAEFTNLASDGIIYVFIDRTQTPHAVQWFWNR